MKARYILTVTLLLLPIVLSGKISEDRKTFEKRIVLEKGEHMVGLSAMGAGLNSNNAEFQLLLNNMTLNGNMYRVSAGYSYAYLDNMSVGFRASYLSAAANIDNLNMNLLSQELSFDLKNVNLKVNGLSAAVFNRNYIGLDRKGSVGVYFEETLAYTRTRSEYGTATPGTYTTSNKVNLSVAPGLILFIIPCVSVQASISIFDLGYCWSNNYKEDVSVGSNSSWKASAKFNVMNLNFGIIVHF